MCILLSLLFQLIIIQLLAMYRHLATAKLLILCPTLRSVRWKACGWLTQSLMALQELLRWLGRRFLPTVVCYPRLESNSAKDLQLVEIHVYSPSQFIIFTPLLTIHQVSGHFPALEQLPTCAFQLPLKTRTKIFPTLQGFSLLHHGHDTFMEDVLCFDLP